MKQWFSAAEILAIGSIALPATEKGLALVAERQGWRDDATRARAREGRGGGWEYHLSLLPADAQAKLIAAENADAADRSQTAWSHFDRLPEKAKAQARVRLAAVERMELLAAGMAVNVAVALGAKECGVSTSTLWNWHRAAQAVDRADRLPALAPRHTGRTATADCDPRAWDFFKADYLRPETPSFEACHRRLMAAAAEHGWSPIPAAKTLRRRLEREIPRGARTLARRGGDAARRIFPHQTRDRTVFTALQGVNADGHRFDVFVRWPDGTIARPVMVAIQDLYSGMLLAHRIEQTENWSAVRHAFADLIESFGIPEQCWLDNGRQFASKWLTGGMANRYRFKVRDDEPAGLLTQLGVQVHWTTPYHGQAKPIERAFRDLCEDIAKHPSCAGAYTGNSPVTKPDNYGRKAIPIDDFRALVAAEIARHNVRPGRRAAACAGRSLAQTFRESVEAPTTLVRRASEAQRRLFLMAAEGVMCRKPTGELQLADNRYWAEPLVEHMGRKVVVRFDPQDLLAGVSVYTLDGRFIVDAACVAATGFDDMAAAREHARRKRAWLKAQRELLELERRMTIGEVARLLPPPEPLAEPQPQIIKLVANAPRPQPAADVWEGAEGFGAAMRQLDSAAVLPFRKETGDPA